MPKALKDRPSILVPTVEEVPRISDAERNALRSSLEKARADIATGKYDVVTPATLKHEFYDEKDIGVPRRSARRRKSR